MLLDSSFLIDLERELDSGTAGPAVEWLRKERGKRDRSLIVSVVSVSEYLEGTDGGSEAHQFVSHFITQGVGYSHASKCAELQKRASKRGSRFGENDAWQIAVAENASASIVGRDSKAFAYLGKRYEEFK